MEQNIIGLILIMIAISQYIRSLNGYLLTLFDGYPTKKQVDKRKRDMKKGFFYGTIFMVVSVVYTLIALKYYV